MLVILWRKLMKPNPVLLMVAILMFVLLACNLPTLGAGETETESVESGFSAPELPEAGDGQDEGSATGTGLNQNEVQNSAAEGEGGTPVVSFQIPDDAPAAPTDLNVPLQVSNPGGSALVGEPVTSGLPFPSGSGIIDETSLQLVSQDGEPVPAAFTVLARWGAAVDDTAAEVRWVLLDFQVNLGPDENAYFFLQEGGPGAEPETPLQLVEEGNMLRIATGAADFSINMTDGSLSGPGMQFPLVGVVRDIVGKEHTAALVDKVETTSFGNMRSAVRLQGPYGESGLDHTTEYWFYAGSPLVRVFHTIENNNPCPLEPEYQQISCYTIGSEGSIAFQDASLRMGLDWEEEPVYVQIGGEGSAYEEMLDGDLVLYQDSSGMDYWDKYANLTDWDGNSLDARPRMQSYVTFRGYRAMMGEQEVDSGDQAQGWMVLEGGGAAWSVGVRDFWQQFPKALRASPDGRVEIGLFPAEFGGEDYVFSLRAGEHKTHEIRLAAASNPDTAMTPLFAAAPPEWYVGSGEFGLTALPDWERWAEHEQFVLYQLETSPYDEGLEHVHDNLFAAITATDFYGIFDYGDWPIDYESYGVSPINAKYDFDLGLWVQWARSGDMRWFRLAEAADRHFADIDVLHTLHEPRHWSDGIIFGHSYHDEEGFTNPHRNEGGAAPDTAYGVPGMLLAHYLTGYQETFGAAIEVADAIEYRTGNDFYLCDHINGACSGEGWALQTDGLYDSNARPVANSLVILTAAYRATQDARYLRSAEAILAFADPSNQPFINGPNGQSGGEEAAIKPWLTNMYLRALAYHLEMRAEYGLEDTYDSSADFLHYADWLHDYAWIELDPLDAVGPRAAYPYLWFFDDRQGDPNDEWSLGNNVPGISNWLLLGADAQAYAYHLSDDPVYLERAAALFRTGAHDPFYPGDNSLYTETKQTINSLIYGNIFLYMDAAQPEQ
jgi:hypothetical protein